MADGRPTYRVVSPLFWDDPDVQSLNLYEQYIALHILTCRQTSGSGLFRFSLATAGEDTKKASQSLTKAFAEVCLRLKWAYHEPSKTLYLPRWWKWNRPDSPNHLRGAMADLVNLPQTPLFKEFALNTEWLKISLHEAFREACRSLKVRLPTQEQELEREKEPEKEPGTGAGEAPSNDGSPPTADGKPKKKSPYTEDFEAWWEHYPKKTGKMAASKAWLLAVQGLALRPDGSRDKAKAILLEAVMAFTASGWGQSGHFVPKPQDWLANGQYDDDRATWSRKEDNGKQASKSDQNIAGAAEWLRQKQEQRDSQG